MKDTVSRTSRAAMCLGKQAFASPQVANKVMRRRGKRRDANKRKQQTYRCDACGLFHIGRPSEPRQNTRASRLAARAYDIEDDTGMV